MNEDMSQFLGVFLDDSGEQIALLERHFLCLEQDASPELLQEIFRAAHTLKGSSRAMGFTAMGELTHAMEDVFDKLRHNELTVFPALMDALFAGLDGLKVMMDEVAAAGQTSLDTGEQTARLRAVLEGEGSAAPAPVVATTEPESEAPSVPGNAAGSLSGVVPSTGEWLTRLSETERMAFQDALDAGCTLYGLRIHFAPDCIMKAVRALMALQMLETVGATLASTPNEEAIEAEAFESSIEVVVATEQDGPALEAAVLRLSEILRVETVALPDLSILKSRVSDSRSETRPTPPAASPPAPLLVSPATLKGRGEPNPQPLPLKGRGDKGEDVPVSSKSGFPTDGSDSDLALPSPGSLSDRFRGGAGGEVSPSSQGGASEPEKEKAETRPDATRAAGAKAPVTSAPAATVRVDVARLDSLLNLVGELVIDRTRIAQLCLQLERNATHSPLLESLNETAAHVGRITDALQTEIMKARMLPVDNVFSRFPRMIRDLAQKLGKEVNFVVEGRETELDRSVIEVVGDPLIHMLRNSVDHGIELPDERVACGKARQGTVWLRARHQDNNIVIEIQDDGKGLDAEKLRQKAIEKGLHTPESAARLTDKEAISLIFSSGFSTAQNVSEVSGRGVGMDIVRSNLDKLGALIDIESKVGVGSTFTVRLPLTLAIIRSLLVEVRGSVYALPLASVSETLQVERQATQRLARQNVLHLRGQTLPLVSLRDAYALELPTAPAEAVVHGPAPEARLCAPRQTEPEAVPSQPLSDSMPDGSRPDGLRPDGKQGASALPSAAPPVATLLAQGLPKAGKDNSLASRQEMLSVVVAGVGDKQAGFVVDGLIGEQEVVIKTLGRFLGDVKGISGATILGDGRVALIVDIHGLLDLAIAGESIAGERNKAHAA